MTSNPAHEVDAVCYKCGEPFTTEHKLKSNSFRCPECNARLSKEHYHKGPESIGQIRLNPSTEQIDITDSGFYWKITDSFSMAVGQNHPKELNSWESRSLEIISHLKITSENDGRKLIMGLVQRLHPEPVGRCNHSLDGVTTDNRSA